MFCCRCRSRASRSWIRCSFSRQRARRPDRGRPSKNRGPKTPRKSPKTTRHPSSSPIALRLRQLPESALVPKEVLTTRRGICAYMLRISWKYLLTQIKKVAISLYCNRTIMAKQRAPLPLFHVRLPVLRLRISADLPPNIVNPICLFFRKDTCTIMYFLAKFNVLSYPRRCALP